MPPERTMADPRGFVLVVRLVGLEVPDGAIRCTSVPGYKLEGGDPSAQVLRDNLSECSVVLGVLTKSGLGSSYVLMELGAAWGFRKTAIPLLAAGVPFAELPGPFNCQRISCRSTTAAFPIEMILR